MNSHPDAHPEQPAEFAAVEQLADLLDGLNPGGQSLAIAFFAARYGAKVAAS